jgi:hypothetical protein
MTPPDPDYWFKPRRYGYGARPVTWQGWAVSIAYLAVLVLLVMHFPNVREGEASPAVALLWLAVIAGLVVGFIAFDRKKTDGDWRWRWGGNE